LPKRERQPACQHSYIAAQSNRKTAQNRERDVSFAAFNSAEIGTINPSRQGKRFLRQANAFALRSDPVSQFLKDCAVVHRPA
jgi:hypothetical protein